MAKPDKSKPKHRPGGKPGADDRAEVVPLKPYGIGAAARLAGIEPETLRIWERRYGLLSPERTEGGHRLYSEHDVEVLRSAKKLTESGMRIGQVAAWSEEEILQQALKVPEPRRRALLDDTSPLVDEVLDAARAFDAPRTAALLDRPRLLIDGREVIHAVYLPALRRAGELWADGALTVGAEHFLEKLITARMHAILNSIADGDAGRLALVACLPGERHEGGAIAAAVELRASGFAVVLLGADTPLREIDAAAERLAPDLLVLAVTNQVSPAVKAELDAVLKKPALADVPLLVGGLSAGGLAPTLRAPAALVESLAALGPRARRAIAA